MENYEITVNSNHLGNKKIYRTTFKSNKKQINIEAEIPVNIDFLIKNKII